MLDSVVMEIQQKLKIFECSLTQDPVSSGFLLKSVQQADALLILDMKNLIL